MIKLMERRIGPLAKRNGTEIIQSLSGKKHGERFTFGKADGGQKSFLKKLVPSSPSLNGINGDAEFAEFLQIPRNRSRGQPEFIGQLPDGKGSFGVDPHNQLNETL
ncbi:hypothetical protein HMSSN036_44080 [Paenibacillus macerans]|nr:hypothetical protein HMSSN036_44080 [Paenibacillus macerans]